MRRSVVLFHAANFPVARLSFTNERPNGEQCGRSLPLFRHIVARRIKVSIYRQRREATTRQAFASRFGSASDKPAKSAWTSPRLARSMIKRTFAAKVARLREWSTARGAREQGSFECRASVNCYVSLADTSSARLWGRRDRELSAYYEEARLSVTRR